MADYSELKRMAEHHLSLGHAYTVATPSVVLALIAENERLERKSANQSESIREYQDLVMGGDVSLGMLKADIRVTTGDRDQVKAENAAVLREATDLAMAIWRRCYAKDSPNFQSFEKASSVIGQIDNMAAGLMSDLEKLRAEVAGLKTGYEACERANAELKAENEALRKHAERYRWLRDSECAGRILRDMGAKVCRHADQRIDAAMGKGGESNERS